MWQISSILFLILLCRFAVIMIRDPRTLRSGVSFFQMTLCLGIALFFLLSEYSWWLASRDMVIGFLILLFILTVCCVLVFPGVLILLFFVEGIRVIRHEGMKLPNLLSLLFSASLFLYLTVWPMVWRLEKNTMGAVLYIVISFSAAYILALMAAYTLSAILNLVHLKKRRNADYIIVLGAGIMGTRVTPLLAARIERGIELLDYNPGAMLILSGGQGSGEEITESAAMAAYAVEKGVDAGRVLLEKRSVSTQENLKFSRELMEGEKPGIIIVTTAYHVFRALLLARQQGIKCVGFGARTKWYFTLNALIREFIGYLRLTWKRHAVVIGIIAGIAVVK